MNRKDFIHKGLLLCTPAVLPFYKSSFTADYLMTVNGPTKIERTGFILPHEHIMVDFIGADRVNSNRYERNEVFDAVLPHLKQLKQEGCTILVECTPAWLGRDVCLLQALSQASGIKLITNTGYYGAAKEKYLPNHAYTASAEELARQWVLEWEKGIDGTGIKPGYIKTGVDTYPLTNVQKKLIAAAALTHLQTGMTIGVHTGDGKAALEELKIIKGLGVKAEAWVWIHAQNESDREIHFKVAKEGGWVSFDGLEVQSIQHYLDFLKDMKVNQLIHKALISHDAGWYHVGEPGGGYYRPHDTLFKHLIPALKKEGFTQNDLNQLFNINPARALSIGIKSDRV